MNSYTLSRRRLLGCAAGAAVAASASSGSPRAAAAGESRPHLSCNSYAWETFYSREKRNFKANLDEGLAEVAQSGMNGYEPSMASPADIEVYQPLLAKHRLEMRSIYVNSTLHVSEETGKSIASILAIARKAKAAGTRIIVTNPSPIRWGGQENKSDQQLGVQAAALDRLGGELKAAGLTLAYHNHDIELRNAAREFHHMMAGTDPRKVSLCLDCHWIYRGSGNSAVALYDILKLYGPRVVELHLRQSREGTWSEAMGEGDIDYPLVAEGLRTHGSKPHLVLEQAPEKGTPATLNALESHRKSREYIDRVFAKF
jgi:inosose dehydratase